MDCNTYIHWPYLIRASLYQGASLEPSKASPRELRGRAAGGAVKLHAKHPNMEDLPLSNLGGVQLSAMADRPRPPVLANQSKGLKTGGGRLQVPGLGGGRLQIPGLAAQGGAAPAPDLVRNASKLPQPLGGSGGVPLTFAARTIVRRPPSSAVARADGPLRAGDDGGSSDPKMLLVQLPPGLDLEGDVGVVGRCCTLPAPPDHRDPEAAGRPRFHFAPTRRPDFDDDDEDDDVQCLQAAGGKRRRLQVLDIKGNFYEVAGLQQLAGTCLVVKITMPRGEGDEAGENNLVGVARSPFFTFENWKHLINVTGPV